MPSPSRRRPTATGKLCSRHLGGPSDVSPCFAQTSIHSPKKVTMAEHVHERDAMHNGTLAGGMTGGSRWADRRVPGSSSALSLSSARRSRSSSKYSHCIPQLLTQFETVLLTRVLCLRQFALLMMSTLLIVLLAHCLVVISPGFRIYTSCRLTPK